MSQSEQSKRPLPRIDAGDMELKYVTNQAWEAIAQFNEPPTLFRSGNLPNRLELDDEGIPRLRPLVPDKMRHVLARAAYWYKEYRDKEYPALPPMHVVKDLLASPDVPLPIITRIVEAPVFSPDGKIQTTPGYHSNNKTYFYDSGEVVVPPVKDTPTKEDVSGSFDLIFNELLGDFPFAGQAEKVHALALFLLPFARDLIGGITPLHLIEAPSPGTGKGLLVDMLSFPALGFSVPTMTEGKDEDEWRKRLTAKIIQRPNIILIDNLRRRLDSAALASALTSPCWEDRILGHSKVISLPIKCVWVATGNNPTLSNEMSRRTIRIRLDANVDRPWLRSGFRHPNLREWVEHNRGNLINAALTIIQNWVVQGRPNDSTVTLGMFESWAKTMGGILNAAGIKGFLGNLDEFYSVSDEEGEILRKFITAWWDRFKSDEVGVSELYGLNESLDEPLELGRGSEKSKKTRLGKELVKIRDRRLENIRVTLAGEFRRAKRWKLVEVQDIHKENMCEPRELNLTPNTDGKDLVSETDEGVDKSSQCSPGSEGETKHDEGL